MEDFEDLFSGDRAFSYNTIVRACNDIMQDDTFLHIDDVLLGCKMLAAVFIIVNVILHYFESKEDNSKPITLYYVAQQAAYIFLVFNFASITMWLDSVLAGFCQALESRADADNNSLYNMVNTAMLTNMTKEELDAGEGSIFYEIWSVLKNLINPYYWITTLAQWIGWFVNTFVVAFMLIERAATLVLLNVLSPFVIALSVLEKFRDMLIKWIKLYIATFLIMPAILIVSVLCTLFYMTLAGNVSLMYGLVTDDMTIVICMVILVKARLFKASVSLLYKLFGV